MYPALQQKFPDPDGDYALYRSYFMWVCRPTLTQSPRGLLRLPAHAVHLLDAQRGAALRAAAAAGDGTAGLPAAGDRRSGGGRAADGVSGRLSQRLQGGGAQRGGGRRRDAVQPAGKHADAEPAPPAVPADAVGVIEGVERSDCGYDFDEQEYLKDYQRYLEEIRKVVAALTKVYSVTMIKAILSMWGSWGE